MALPEHMERVADEAEELGTKLEALKAFVLKSPVFKTLPLRDRELLHAQAGAMTNYSSILSDRLARANKD